MLVTIRNFVFHLLQKNRITYKETIISKCPRLIFSAMEVPKSTGSCPTIPICSLSQPMLMFFRSTPSRLTENWYIYIYIILYKHNITVKWFGQKTVLCLCMFISCFSPFLVDQLYWHQILLTSIRDHNVQLYLFSVKFWFQQVNSARICNNLYTTEFC